MQSYPMQSVMYACASLLMHAMLCWTCKGCEMGEAREHKVSVVS